MSINTGNPYFRTKVLTSTPEELRLMLIEGGIRFLREGREALGRNDYEKTFDRFTSARNIVLELTGCLRHEVAPELCGKLEAVYNYVFRLTVEGSFEKDAKKIDEAISLLEYDRETWVLLMQKIAEERGGTAAVDESRAPLSISA